ncbi:asparagine synthase (glutamine-hydrolyzing) [Amycolatopsis arida]|uniref:asparagine synthase (glutamine-hydrolyzing) n=1 Tax=Amycolatopsis arida TaxID=587909 RepID=UPI001FB90F87|nr:asparagine synthase (glutamine-hydrolyzing) [Amycolatopsis arida]
MGWVDFSRDLTGWRSAVTTMTGALATRGPDGETMWVSAKAALGHRRFAVPSGGEEAIAVLERGGEPVAAAVTGFLTERDALREALRVAGSPAPADAADATLVALAHLAWGPDAASRLEGGFAAAVWDGRTEELVLLRDRLGNQPLYYHQPAGGGLLFGSERKALLAHPLVDARVDADGLRELFTYAGTPGHGILVGVHQVRPGHVLRFGRGGVTEQEYWGLRTAAHTDDLETTVATVRELLARSVRSQLDDGDSVCALLSGGIDSSAVVALAGQALAERGADPLMTFTVSFRNEREFRPDEVWGTEDAPFVADVVAHVGTEHKDLVLDTAAIMDPVARAMALRAKDVPSPLGNMNTSLLLLCSEVGRYARVALLGEIADAVFGGFNWVHNPELARARTLPWLAMARHGGGEHGMGGDLLDRDLLTKLDLNGYAHAQYANSIAEVEHLPGEDEQERLMRRITYLHLTRWLETLLPHDEQIGLVGGLQTRMPFCDHRLVQYVYNVPWSMKTFDGREKSLLRAAVADLLPESVVNRAKSPYPVTQDPAYGHALCDALGALVADPAAPAHDLVDKRAVRALLDDRSVLDSGPRAWVARANVEIVLGLDRWLREYGVRTVL